MGDGRTQHGQACLGARRNRRAGGHCFDRGGRQRSGIAEGDGRPEQLGASTVGPYQLYGSELVAICAATGTDYLDLCGEPVWMRQMIDSHEAEAQSTGARIVFSCGFDSLPFELGVFFCQQTAKNMLGAPVGRVKGRVRAMKGTFSGGTAASIKATFAAAAKDLSLVALLKNPFSLTPGFEGPKQPPGNKPLFDPDLDAWTAPFVMATINTRSVHRSNLL